MFSLKSIRAFFVAVFVVFGSTAASAQKAVPLSQYGELPQVEDAAISPSGESIAVLLTVDGIRQFYFINSEMQVFRRMAVGEGKVRGFTWVGEDRLLLITGQTEDLYGFTADKAEFNTAQLIPVRGDGEPMIVFDRSANLLNAVFGNYGIRQIGGEWVLAFGALELRDISKSHTKEYVFDHGRPFLYALEASSGKARRMAVAPREGVDREWLVDAAGNVSVTMDVNLADGDWDLRGPSNNRLASGTQRRGAVGLVGFGYDGSSVIYSERDDQNIAQWYEVPLAGGTPRPFLRDVDVETLYFDDTTGKLIGYLDAAKGPVFADPSMQKTATGIEQAFQAFETRLVDWTPGLGKVIIRTSGNQDSGTWYVVDMSKGSAAAFAYERMAIGPEEVGPISTVSYTAADGLEMDGILTLPPGREAKNLPVVMLPHGGPHSSDRAEFDWWAQAFASRGYAVFQPNFRGSTNRSQAFKLAGYGEWGRKMQTDISDGLSALAEKGIVDPARACIVGASYGGYAALAGVTIQQDIYRCAVAVAPVSDLSALYDEDYRASGGSGTTKAGLLDQLGPKDGWDAVSPRRLAGRADAPIMLIHGRDDTVVPYSHSKKMADALEDAGKPLELVTLDGEDHWLSNSATRLEMLKAAVGFVEKHNPPE